MNKLLPLTLLGLVVAVSGCTQVATQEDLQDQTRDIKQHTEDVVDNANKPVTKYEILEIDKFGSCTAEDEEGNLQAVSRADVTLFELSKDGVQSFDNSKLLIKNEINEVEADFDCQNESHDEVEARLDSVKFKKSVYQNGTQIASGTNTCEIQEDVELERRVWEIHEFAEAMAETVYSDCFGVDYRGENQ